MKHFLLATALLATSFVAHSQATLQAPVLKNARQKNAVAFTPNHVLPVQPAFVPEERNCGTMQMDSILRASGMATGTLEDFEKWMKVKSEEYLDNISLQKQLPPVYTIPVVVHIIHNGTAIGSGINISQAQVQSQITALNNDFRRLNSDTSSVPTVFKPLHADVEIQFCLAVVDTSGNVLTEPGIDRINRNTRGWTAPPYNQTYINNTIKPQTSWDPDSYFNIWVTQLGGGLLGYAQFPSASGLGGMPVSGGAANTDGIVVGYNYFGTTGTLSPPFHLGRTATHEVGHWLGLRHIWGDGTCANDFCADTPPHEGSHGGCPTHPYHVNTCGGGSSPNGEMFMNYMDYTNDACMYMFTNGQKIRMRTVMTNSPRRVSLATSTACNSSVLPVADFVGTPLTVTAGCSVNFTDLTTGNPTSWAWNFGGGGTPNTSTTQNPVITFNTPGTYNVTLIAANANGSDTVVKPNYITVVPVACQDTVTNYSGTATLYTSGTAGYIAGHNTYGDDAKADKYSFCGPSQQLTEIVYFFGKATGTGNIQATVWDANGTGGSPGTVLSTQNVAISSLAAPGTGTLVTLPTPVTISGDYFVGIQFTYAAGDTVALITNQAGQSSPNTAWERWNTNVWYEYNDPSSWNISVSHAIFPIFNNAPAVSVTPTADTLCGGTSATLTASGASTYSWSPSTGLSGTTGVAVTATPAATTTYFVTGTNALGCTDTDSSVISVSASPVVTVSPSAPAVCPGGSATLTASGATTYNWSPATGLSATSGATVTATPASTTTYSVIGSNASGCSDTAFVTVTVNPSPSVLVSPSNPVICNGASVSLTASGATSYSWSPATGLSSTTGANVTASPAGTTTYTVTGTDANGCTSNAATTVTVNPVPTVSVTPAAPVICAGTSVSLTASGANSYTWSPSGTLSAGTGASVTASPTTTTTYTITGMNASGCTATTTVTVTVNPLQTLSVNPSAPGICAGGNVNLTASGANTYAWSPSTGLSTTSGATVNASPASTTTYTVTGTSTAGCTASTNVTVSVNPGPSVTVNPSSPSICSGSSVTISATGGSSYTWSPSTGLNTSSGSTVIASPTTTTTYTVTATSSGCPGSFTATSTVTVNPNPVVNVSPASSTICAGSSASLTASGASSYAWTPATGLNTTTGSTVVANPTATQTYTVTGTDANGCSATATSIVSVNPLPVISISPAAPSICAGGSTTLTATGAATYTWSPASGLSSTSGATVTASPAATTSYTVTGTDINGCTSTATVTVTVNTATVSVSPSSAAICPGSSATLTASGASTYSWTPSAGLSATSGSIVTATPAATTTYMVTGTSSSGCTATTSVTVTVFPQPTVTVTPANSFVCSGSSVTLTASGTVSYSWQPQSGNTTVNSGTGTSVTATVTNFPGTIVVTGTDANGCTASDTVLLTPVSNSVSISPTNPSVCQGNNVTLTATAQNQSTYSWSPSVGLNTTSGASVVASPSVTTLYTVTAVDTNGCTANDTVTVSVTSTIPVTVTASQDTVCEGTPVILTASGATFYTWSPSGPPLAVNPVLPTTTTTYYVTGSNTNGCSGTDSITIVVNPSPTVTVFPPAGRICSGGTWVFIAFGASNYTWAPTTGLTPTTGPLVVASPSSSMIYTVTGTDASGCSGTAFVPLQVIPPVNVSISAQDPLCFEGESGTATANVVSGGAGGFSYDWNDPMNQETQTATDLPAGTYIVEVSDSVGCSGFDTITLSDPLPLSVELTAENPSCGFANGSVFSALVNGTAPYSYLWNEGSTSADLHDLKAGDYSLLVTDANGCMAGDSTLLDDQTTEDCIFVPSAFSPNHDGQHDVLVIQNGDFYGRMSLQVFNRWGNKVYENENYDNTWDGTLLGEPLPGGVYYYILDLNDGEKPRAGSLTILR